LVILTGDRPTPRGLVDDPDRPPTDPGLEVVKLPNPNPEIEFRRFVIPVTVKSQVPPEDFRFREFDTPDGPTPGCRSSGFALRVQA
jgi:hypothetical protein